MVDISDQMDQVTSTPAEAADHIAGGNFMDLGADVFKEYKGEFNPVIDKFQRPNQASPTVADYASQTPEHAALLAGSDDSEMPPGGSTSMMGIDSPGAPDLYKFSTVDKMMQYAGDQINGRRSTQEQINDLTLKKMFQKDKFSDDDDLQLDGLNQLSQTYSDYGLSPKEKLLGDVSGGIASMVHTVGKNAALIGSFTAAGFATTALPALPALAVPGVGVGTVLAAGYSGAQTGFNIGTGIAMTKDMVESSIAGTYNGLDQLKNDEGSKLNIDDDTKKNISIGVGVTTGVITAALGKLVSGQLPFLTKYASPEMVRNIVQDPANEALKKVLWDTGKIIAESGGANTLMAAAQIAATEFAKNHDPANMDESSFKNTLINIGNAINTTFSKKHSDELTHAGEVGAGVGAVMAGVNAPLSYKTNLENNTTLQDVFIKKASDLYDQYDAMRPYMAKDVTPEGAPLQLTAPKGYENSPTDPIGRSVKVLKVEDVINAAHELSDSTQMKKLSPAEFDTLTKNMMDKAGIDNIYLDKEELQGFATDADRAKAVRDIIDPTGQAAAAVNAPVQVPAHEFMKLVDAHPEASGLLRLNPEDPSANQAKEFLQSHVDAEKQRQEKMVELNTPDLKPEERAALEQQLAEIKNPNHVSHDIFNEADYLDDTKLRAAMEQLVPEAERSRYLAANQRARMDVVDSIDETAQNEMNKIIDITHQEGMDTEYSNQLERIKDNPNLALVDKFGKFDGGVENKDVFDSMRANHEKPDRSPFAIDPASLPENLKYLIKDPQLKAHKVFVKGGITANESASWLGVRSGEDLLKILASTPNREQIAAVRTQAREVDVKAQAIASVDLNKTANANAYNAKIDNELQTLNYMKAHEWTDMKGGIKRIALTPRPKADYVTEAQDAVAKTVVGKLNVNQFKVGERKSHRIAMDAILKHNPEKAFTTQENVIKNIALAKETSLAIGQINKVIRFAKRIQSPENQQILKDAGYAKAANELLDLFHLSPKMKDQAERGQFLKYVQKATERGQAVINIPDRLTGTAKSMNDMTVEQVLAVGDALKNILHNAKEKNIVQTELNNRKEAMSMDYVAHQVKEQLTKNISYDPKRIEHTLESTEGAFKPLVKLYRDLTNMVEIPKYLIGKMDDDKSIGLMHDLLYEPMNKARNAEQSLEIQIYDQLHKILKERIGAKEYQRMANSSLTIPEFAKSPGLSSGGRISELELFELAHHFGNEGNLAKVQQTTGVDNLITMDVLGRYLTHDHWAMIQDHWNTFKSLEPKVKEVYERTTGVDFKSVEAKPFLAKTKDGSSIQLDGGYYPLHTKTDRGLIMAKQIAGSAEVAAAQSKRQQFAGEAMTKDGHTLERTGSDSMLDLNANRMGSSLAQVNHYITHTEPVMEVSKVLTDKEIRNEVIKVLGHEGYEHLGDWLIDSTNSVQKRANNTSEKSLMKIYNHIGQGVSIVDVGFKLTTLLMHSVALGNIVNELGYATGLKHLGAVMNSIVGNLEKFSELQKWMEEVHPHTQRESEHLDQSVADTLNSLIPTKHSKVPGLSASIAAKRYAVSGIMSGISRVDQKVKVIGGLTLMRAALNGDIKGVDPMDYKAVTKYVSSTLRDTTIHSRPTDKTPLQKIPMAKNWVKFMGPAFVFLNYTSRQLRISAKGAVGAFNNASGRQGFGNEEGGQNFKSSYDYAKMGLGAFAGITFLSAIVAQWHKTVQERPKPFDEKGAFSDPKKFLQNSEDFLMQAPEAIIGMMPLVGAMQYSLEQHWKRDKQVITPQDKALNETVTGIDGLIHLLKDHERMSAKQAKGLVNTVGVLSGFPTEGILQRLGNPDLSNTPVYIKSKAQQLSDAITKFIKNNDDVHPDFVQDLKNIQQQIDPPKSDSSAEVPQKIKDTIKQIESQGQWHAQNPDSTAGGLYQFTKSTWDTIRKEAPELGLTEMGRVSKDTEQQERAMDYYTQDNMAKLKAAKLPLDTEDIYAAHFLGGQTAVQVLSAPDKAKLKTLVGEQVMEANKFKPTMTVGDFKDWILQKTSQAESQLEAKNP